MPFKTEQFLRKHKHFWANELWHCYYNELFPFISLCLEISIFLLMCLFISLRYAIHDKIFFFKKKLWNNFILKIFDSRDRMTANQKFFSRFSPEGLATEIFHKLYWKSFGSFWLDLIEQIILAFLLRLYLMNNL